MDENLPFELIDQDAETLYANLVSFNINPEEVCLGLGVRDVQNTDRVNIHSYLYMSVPHFLRFAEAVNKQVEMLIEKGVISREPEQ
jgi:hypothetical protein